jgi:hypothetical protein
MDLGSPVRIYQHLNLKEMLDNKTIETVSPRVYVERGRLATSMFSIIEGIAGAVWT